MGRNSTSEKAAREKTPTKRKKGDSPKRKERKEKQTQSPKKNAVAMALTSPASKERRNGRKSLTPSKVLSATRQNESPIEKVLVGGPMLGLRAQETLVAAAGNDASTTPTVGCEHHHRVQQPLITPLVRADGNLKDEVGKTAQRFILLPQTHCIKVLAYTTGMAVGTLVPTKPSSSSDAAAAPIVVESMCITSCKRTFEIEAPSLTETDDDAMHVDEPSRGTREDVIALVGSTDGVIYEFLLNDLVASKTKNNTIIEASQGTVSCGPYKLPHEHHLLRLRPRRILEITKGHSLAHLAAAPTTATNQDTLLFALVQLKVKVVSVGTEPAYVANGGTAHTDSRPKLPAQSLVASIQLVRIAIPPSDDTETTQPQMRALNKESRTKVIDVIQCDIGAGNYANTAPFYLGLVTRPIPDNTKDRGIYTVIGRSSEFHVHYHQQELSHNGECKDIDSSITHFDKVSMRCRKDNPFSAISCASSDMTCGLFDGGLVFYHNAWTMIYDYHMAVKAQKKLAGNGAKRSKLKHPSNTIVSTKAHWHAHPVTCLAYEDYDTALTGKASKVDPLLYSGGEESVMVTWQLSSGSNKPSQVLPRLATSSLVHLVTLPKSYDDEGLTGTILVVSMDNTLQLIKSHNQTIVWKVQGMASQVMNDPSLPVRHASLTLDPRSIDATDSSNPYPSLIVTGMQDSPGYIHWYDPKLKSISSSLEVIPFNRVSRKEIDELPMPSPSIVHNAWTKHDLITVEESPSENSAIGYTETLADKNQHGIITTIHFWSFDPTAGQNKNAAHISQGPYRCDATMTYPHGMKNRIAGLGVSKDGQFACTVSNDENAFRVWQKMDIVPSANSEETNSTAWECRCSVTIPSGFSNFSTGSHAVSFSDDNSILAIGFGPMVTLWDNKGVRLLTALRHIDDDNSEIKKISFVNVGLLQNLLLTESSTGVSLQSPFGEQSNFKSWSYVVDGKFSEWEVTASEVVATHAAVAIAIHEPKSESSCVILVDGRSGKPGIELSGSDTSPTSMISTIAGRISSLVGLGQYDDSLNWNTGVGNGQVSGKDLKLYCLTSGADILLLQTTNQAQDDDQAIPTAALEWRLASQNGVAARLASIVSPDRRLRPAESETSFFDILPPKMKATTLGIFEASTGEGGGAPSSSKLPLLTANFVRAIIKRSVLPNAMTTSTR